MEKILNREQVYNSIYSLEKIKNLKTMSIDNASRFANIYAVKNTERIFNEQTKKWNMEHPDKLIDIRREI